MAYGAVTLLWLVFSAVYEWFSHGIISRWMVTLALWPLLGGVLPFYLAYRRQAALSAWGCALWHCGLATLLIMSLLMGVMEIFGGRFEYGEVMAVVGAVLCAVSLCCEVMWRKKHLAQDYHPE